MLWERVRYLGLVAYLVDYIGSAVVQFFFTMSDVFDLEKQTTNICVIT